MFAESTITHQTSVGTNITSAYSSHAIGMPWFANRPARYGPQSAPVSSAQPGSTAISNVLRMMSADPRPGSGRPRACTSAHAIGIRMAVRTVIDGMPSVSTNPMSRNAPRMPA